VTEGSSAAYVSGDGGSWCPLHRTTVSGHREVAQVIMVMSLGHGGDGALYPELASRLTLG
jgi:hypothetical protein